MEQLRKLRTPKRKLTKKEREKLGRPLSKEASRKLGRGLREAGRKLAREQKEGHEDAVSQQRMREFVFTI